MSLLKRIFGRRPAIDASSAKIDKFTYLMNYRDHYGPILFEDISNRQLAELFLFRGWTTQFGYRIFSTDQSLSTKLIGETVNLTKYVGLGVFRITHDFSIEEELEDDYMNLLDSRWQAYDIRVSTHLERSIPTAQIINTLADFMRLQNPASIMSLSGEFLGHLNDIKATAMDIGILRV